MGFLSIWILSFFSQRACEWAHGLINRPPSYKLQSVTKMIWSVLADRSLCHLASKFATAWNSECCVHFFWMDSYVSSERLWPQAMLRIQFSECTIEFLAWLIERDERLSETHFPVTLKLVEGGLERSAGYLSLAIVVKDLVLWLFWHLCREVLHGGTKSFLLTLYSERWMGSPLLYEQALSSCRHWYQILVNLVEILSFLLRISKMV
jgi:hypothetical protein